MPRSHDQPGTDAAKEVRAGSDRVSGLKDNLGECVKVWLDSFEVKTSRGFGAPGVVDDERTVIGSCRGETAEHVVGVDCFPTDSTEHPIVAHESWVIFSLDQCSGAHEDTSWYRALCR